MPRFLFCCSVATVVAALHLALATSAAAGAELSCSERIYHAVGTYACAGESDGFSTCAEFDARCVIECKGNIGTACSDLPHCELIAGQCAPKCSIITDSDKCIGTNDCVYYNSRCLTSCGSLTAGFVRDATTCASDICTWASGMSECLPTCEVAKSPQACNELQRRASSCSWDFIAKSCVRSCKALTTANDCNSVAGGGCQWVLRSPTAGNCRVKCSAATDQAACELGLPTVSGDCIWLLGSADGTTPGKCTLRCSRLRAYDAASTATCKSSGLCDVDKVGRCNFRYCETVASQRSCMHNTNAQCLWHGAGFCTAACGQYGDFDGMQCASRVVDGANVCYEEVVESDGASTTYCRPRNCGNFSGSSLQNLCTSLNCANIGASDTCNTLCSSYVTQEECALQSSYCSWNQVVSSGGATFFKCVQVCSAATSQTQCQAVEHDCSWIAAAQACRPRCTDISVKEGCLENGCAWDNTTLVLQGCTVPCSSYSSTPSACFYSPSGCWRNNNICTKNCYLLPEKDCTSSGCTWDGNFRVCSTPSWYTPSFAAQTAVPATPQPATPAPPATSAPVTAAPVPTPAPTAAPPVTPAPPTSAPGPATPAPPRTPAPTGFGTAAPTRAPTTVSPAGNDTNNKSSTGDSSSASTVGGLPLPAIAGAAGGGVLVIIIIALYMLKRRAADSDSGTTHREFGSAAYRSGASLELNTEHGHGA